LRRKRKGGGGRERFRGFHSFPYIYPIPCLYRKGKVTARRGGEEKKEGEIEYLKKTSSRYSPRCLREKRGGKRKGRGGEMAEAVYFFSFQGGGMRKGRKKRGKGRGNLISTAATPCSSPRLCPLLRSKEGNGGGRVSERKKKEKRKGEKRQSSTPASASLSLCYEFTKTFIRRGTGEREGGEKKKSSEKKEKKERPSVSLYSYIVSREGKNWRKKGGEAPRASH